MGLGRSRSSAQEATVVDGLSLYDLMGYIDKGCGTPPGKEVDAQNVTLMTHHLPTLKQQHTGNI